MSDRKQIHKAYCKLLELANSIDSGDNDVTELQISQVCFEIKLRAESIRRSIEIPAPAVKVQCCDGTKFHRSYCSAVRS